MPEFDSSTFTLALLETPGIGWKTLGAILRRSAVAGRAPHQFLDLSPDDLAREYGIRRSTAEQLPRHIRIRLSDSEQNARWMARNGVSVITILDATYPAALSARLAEPPPALFAYGNFALISQRAVAAANSNGAPEGALAAVDVAVTAAVESGFAVVTGHNRPAYQRPALAARRNGGRVIYVMDRGLLHGFGGDLTHALFPAARIWGPSFDPTCDLALSPFPLRAQGIGANNRRRDSVIFALADIILAGSVRPGGGMERECLAAIQRGQVVLANEGSGLDSLEGAVTVDFCSPEALGKFLAQ
jgi:hypothetical protein